MLDLSIGDVSVYSDYLVVDHTNNLVFANILSRSTYSVQSAISSIYFERNVHATLMDENGVARVQPFTDEILSGHSYLGYMERSKMGKVSYTHGVVKSELINKSKSVNDDDTYLEAIIIVNEHHSIEDALFDTLFENHDLPLLDKWKPYFVKEMRGRFLKPCIVYASDSFSYEMKSGSRKTDVKNWQFFKLNIERKKIDEIISNGLANGSISIADSSQKPLVLTNLDSYFMNYGDQVVESVLKQLKPAIPNIGTLEYELKNKVPLPAQNERVNGIVNHFIKNDYLILNSGMGTGKTLMAIVAVAMSKENSRTIVMAPSIMLTKWADEIEDIISDATAKIITSFEDVVALRDLIGKSPVGKEFFIFSKDFAKLSYEQVPAVSKEKDKTLPFKKCNKCGHVHYAEYGYDKCKCGHEEFTEIRSSYHMHGAICPDCGELVLPNHVRIQDHRCFADGDSSPLWLCDFENTNSANYQCKHCGGNLWQPSIRKLKLDNENLRFQERNETWMKIKLPRNKAKKTYKTIYITKDAYKKGVEEGTYREDNHTVSKISSARKYAPAKYIKKMLGREFFDFGIFDEVHMFKNANSAQGHAFSTLLRTCKKKLILTGTLSGGTASDLFYILFNLDPQLMLRKGYGFHDFMKFAVDYGVVEEKKYFADERTYFNKTSKGKSVGTKKILPGISTRVYSEFLLANTIFFDLSELSKYMPNFYEIPVRVEMTTRMKKLYTELTDTIRKLLREKGGQKLAAQLRPIAMALPDAIKLDPIIHPLDGHIIHAMAHELDEFLDSDGLLPKERKLLEILEKELAEDRPCFVYSDFTGDNDKNTTERLQMLIEEKLNLKGKVAILKANTCPPINRMEWIKKKAASGIKVFITNPKLTEVGLDFIFKFENKLYNYPTIIFFQVSPNLFTVWQAACRGYRLIQNLECRTYYIYYANSLQQVAVENLASKKAAVSVMQGNFSAEGLSAMASGDDSSAKMAEALMNGVGNDKIDELFKKVNKRIDEYVTEDEQAMIERILNSFHGITDQLQLDMDVSDERKELLMNLIVNEAKKGKGKKTVLAGQLSLF